MPLSKARSPTRCASSPVTEIAPDCTGSAFAPSRCSTSTNSVACGERTITALCVDVFTKSSIGPAAMSRPRPITTSLSAISAISESRWLDTNTDRPEAAKPCNNWRIHWMPCGSRPLAGSSRIRVCGSPSNAAASPSRWPMPRENVFGFLRATVTRPSCSRTWSTRFVEIPLAVASMRRWLRALRVGWKGLASSSAPTCCMGCLREVNGTPSKVVEPVPWSRPSISRIVVDLPAPFGPRKPVTLPGSTSKERSSTAALPEYVLPSPRAWITAMSRILPSGGCPGVYGLSVRETLSARRPPIGESVDQGHHMSSLTRWKSSRAVRFTAVAGLLAVSLSLSTANASTPNQGTVTSTSTSVTWEADRSSPPTPPATRSTSPTARRPVL